MLDEDRGVVKGSGGQAGEDVTVPADRAPPAPSQQRTGLNRCDTSPRVDR